MFSIIIPLYNKAIYVEKAIQSVLNQTYTDYELIIVDDGSTDNSLAVVKKLNKLKSKQISIISQKNQGVSIARNNGVDLAKNPYICFLDADDWWKTTFLEEMKTLIESYPSAGIYGSSYFKVKDSQYIQANIGVEDDFGTGLINYCKVYAKTLWMPLWTGAVIVPKTIYTHEKGFKPNLKLGEDFDLWIRISLKHPVAYLNKPLAYYNQDVQQDDRAIGHKFYKPEEHMLFTDYGDIIQTQDFRFLYERLALYGLLPYYLNRVNVLETNHILEKIDFTKHEKRYLFYYKFPFFIVKMYFNILKLGSIIKNKLSL